MDLETFLFQKKACGRHNDCLLCENLSSSIHGHWLRPHHVTITLWKQDILYHATFNWCSLKRSSVKLMKLLVRCLNASWKSFYVNLPFKRLFCDILKAYLQSCCYSRPIRVEQTVWLLLLGTRNPGRGCWSLWKPYLIIWWLALGF